MIDPPSDILFALLDATRDPLRILVMLRSSGEEYQSLYEGMQGRMLEVMLLI
jgi:hypothetical protein